MDACGVDFKLILSIFSSLINYEMPRQSRHVGGLDGVEEVDQEFAPNSRQISSKKFLDIRFYSKSVSMIYNIRFVLILQKLIIRAVFLLENIFQSSALPEN